MIAAYALLYANGSSLAQDYKGYANPQYLADTQWLKENLSLPGLRIVDLRPLEEYRTGHIRNAVQLDVNSLRTVKDGIPGMMISAREIENILSAKGIGNDTQVVAYDNVGGLFAARFFITLRHYGHNAVKILDGGIRAWVADGNYLTTDTPTISPAKFRAGYSTNQIVDLQWVLKNLQNPEVVFLDARSPAEYRGEEIKAKRGGHIPGAININWVDNLYDDKSARFRSAAELKKMYMHAGITPDKLVITYCQSGMRASHSYFTLLLLGYPNVKVYDGSWVEWGNREGLPSE
jgi:thiosulfate/3-mercaptopyruvate sulfurtransferase